MYRPLLRHRTAAPYRRKMLSANSYSEVAKVVSDNTGGWAGCQGGGRWREVGGGQWGWDGWRMGRAARVHTHQHPPITPRHGTTEHDAIAPMTRARPRPPPTLAPCRPGQHG